MAVWPIEYALLVRVTAETVGSVAAAAGVVNCRLKVLSSDHVVVPDGRQRRVMSVIVTEPALRAWTRCAPGNPASVAALAVS